MRNTELNYTVWKHHKVVAANFRNRRQLETKHEMILNMILSNAQDLVRDVNMISLVGNSGHNAIKFKII